MRWLSHLASVMVRPRQTMRRILDAPPDRMVIPLVLLTIVSAIIGDVNLRETREVIERSPQAHLTLLIIGVMILTIVVMVGLFYLFAWAVAYVGRLLEGTGSNAAVRSALAWGSAPVVWALLYRIPAAIWAGAPGEAKLRATRGGGMTFDPGQLGSGCGTTAVLALIELIMLIWCLVVVSGTLAEAHTYSRARAFGTLALCVIAPFVILIAAVLANLIR